MSNVNTKPMVNVVGFYRDLLVRLSRANKFSEPAHSMDDYVAERFVDKAGDLHMIELQMRLHGIEYKDRDLLKSYYGLSIVGAVPEYQLIKNIENCADANTLRQKVGTALDHIVAKDQLVTALSAIHPELWKK